MSVVLPLESVKDASVESTLYDGGSGAIDSVSTQRVELVIGGAGLSLSLREGDRLVVHFPSVTLDQDTRVDDGGGNDERSVRVAGRAWMEVVRVPSRDGDLFESLLAGVESGPLSVHPGLQLGDWVLIEDGVLIFHHREPAVVEERITRDCLLRQLRRGADEMVEL